MTGSRRKSNAETNFALEALSPIDLRRRSVGTASHLAVPWSARLSADRVLSWKWQSPSQLTSRGPSGTTSRQPGKVDSMLWRKFAALSFGSDEDIRKFAERWGPLRGGPTETIAEWRRLATLASALVRSSVACCAESRAGTLIKKSTNRPSVEWMVRRVQRKRPAQVGKGGTGDRAFF